MKINHPYFKYQIKFSQIYKLQGYEQYNMHDNFINVLANVDQTQWTFPHLPHDGATIGVFLKWCFEYKSSYMLGMFVQIWWWLVYKILIETPLYKDLNVTIHHQWASLFTWHMNLESQIPICNNASFNNSNSNNEELHCTTTDSMIHNFLDIPKMMVYENTISFIALSQNFHPLCLFKDKHLEELNFQHYSMNNLDKSLKVFHVNWRAPNSLRDSNVSPNWKQRKSKESGHVPWLAAL